MTPPSDYDLAHVASLAQRLVRQEDAVAETTAKLQELLTQYRYTAEQLLPEAMREVGIAEFTLTNDQKVTVESRFIGAKLTDPEGLAWVEDQGASDLIKTTIRIDLPASMVDEAREIYAQLQGHRLSNQFTNLTLETYVHQSTIAAFAKELFDGGHEPPLERLGVHQRVTARVGDRQLQPATLKAFVKRNNDQ